MVNSNSSQPSKPVSSAASSSYDAFNAVDKMVAKPVMGSDGAAAWQSFRQESKVLAHRTSSAPLAPLKKVDRLAFSSWQEEQDRERQVRKKAGESDLHA